MSAHFRMVAFGELMLRLNPPGHERIVQASHFEVRFTGAEANVAVLLAGLGAEAACISRVPATEIGQACVNFLRRFGVDTSHIVRGGERLGLFYLETGAAQRASKVIYDRAQSALRSIEPAELDWPAILDGASWFHFSGTAPALGDRVLGVLRDGLESARARGIRVSCDLNYRAKLWSPDEARASMTSLMPLVDVLIGNEEDAGIVFGITAEGSDVTRGDLVVSSYQRVAERLMEAFGFSHVATTLRTSLSASVNRWAGLLYDGHEHHVSRSYEISPIVDRVGGGDAFSAGLIFGLAQAWPPPDCLEFAVAASCLKHSLPGDLALISRAEIDALLAGDASGRVQR
jgi:2-dehydro-3-deoxygluconokinase